MEGKFTVQKTKHAFSSIAMDHAHEQMNACIKGDGGAVGLTENPSALLRWMVAGPEIARCIQEFEVREEKGEKKTVTMIKQQVSRTLSSKMYGLWSLYLNI